MLGVEDMDADCRGRSSPPVQLAHLSDRGTVISTFSGRLGELLGDLLRPAASSRPRDGRRRSEHPLIRPPGGARRPRRRSGAVQGPGLDSPARDHRVGCRLGGRKKTGWPATLVPSSSTRVPVMRIDSPRRATVRVRLFDSRMTSRRRVGSPSTSTSTDRAGVTHQRWRPMAHRRSVQVAVIRASGRGCPTSLRGDLPGPWAPRR